MSSGISTYFQQNADLFRHAAQADLDIKVARAVDMIVAALRRGSPVLVCGNGGSAADAMHIAAELVGRFSHERRGFNVRALVTDPAILTAWSNDYSYETVFSRQVEAYGSPGGVVWGITTSGNSPNVVAALNKGRAMSMSTLALTGSGSGKVAEVSDVLIDVPSTSTPRIQELHICVYHYMCGRIEEMFINAPW